MFLSLNAIKVSGNLLSATYLVSHWKSLIFRLSTRIGGEFSTTSRFFGLSKKRKNSWEIFSRNEYGLTAKGAYPAAYVPLLSPAAG
jgi:hypothetical protein